jgi:ABC-type transport system involved in cytochrome c biogenesis permease subunit
MDYHIFVNVSMAAFLAAFFSYAVSLVSKKAAARIAADVFFYLAGLLAAAAMVFIGLASGRIPLSNTYETMLLMAFVVPLLYLFIMKMDSSGVIAAGLSFLCLALIASSSFLDSAPRPLVPALKSNWLTIHVMLSFISYASFAVAFISAIVFLASREKDRSSADEVSYRCILLGYPFLTLGIVTGAVWANQAWGSYWSWDPKETWALITWLIYGAYLHMRLSYGIKGIKSSVLAIIGFVLVLFTYFGVNYLLSGLHSYR